RVSAAWAARLGSAVATVLALVRVRADAHVHPGQDLERPPRDRGDAAEAARRVLGAGDVLEVHREAGPPGLVEDRGVEGGVGGDRVAVVLARELLAQGAHARGRAEAVGELLRDPDVDE